MNCILLLHIKMFSTDKWWSLDEFINSWEYNTIYCILFKINIIKYVDVACESSQAHSVANKYKIQRVISKKLTCNFLCNIFLSSLSYSLNLCAPYRAVPWQLQLTHYQPWCVDLMAMVMADGLQRVYPANGGFIAVILIIGYKINKTFISEC